MVVLILENQSGDYLITQRKSGKHLAGYWEFPGGKVEPGESLETALQREIQEELNYRPPHPVPATQINHRYPDVQVTLHFYHQLDSHPQVTANEQQAMRWASLAELTTTQLPEANLPVLDWLRSNRPPAQS